MLAAPPSYESVFHYFSRSSYEGGMESSTDFLPLFIAMIQNAEPLPTRQRLAELAYYLNDTQRDWLRQCSEAASRLDDAEIAREISEERYHAEKARRFGVRNPEPMDFPFWKFMVRRRWSAAQARRQFDSAYREQMSAFADQQARGIDPVKMQLPHYRYGAAVWSFDRFGMSQTHLPDGRTVFIAGEHEDFYDVDFCIYNDAIVIDQDLHITIYGYSESDFLPTDFHSATLADEGQIYIIGSLGYRESRQIGETPVYRLDSRAMRIERVPTRGVKPGWISRHVAEYEPERHGISISGGKILTEQAGKQSLQPNVQRYWLDLNKFNWTVE